MANTNKDLSQFPSQKRPDKKKNKKWVADCIEAAEQIALFRDERIRESHQNKLTNYNLANDILDPKDVQRVCNPFNLKINEFPAKMQNYPVANPKIDLLIGEEIKRRFDWRARVINDSAQSEKEEELNEQYERLLQELVASNLPPEEVQKKLKKFEKYRNFTYQDKRELTMTRILKYLWQKEDLPTLFNRGYHDVLLAGEEIYGTDIVAGEPIAEKWNPLNVFTIASGESNYIEDSDIIVHTSYISPGKAIDWYYEELTPKEVDAIEDGTGSIGKRSGSTQILNYNTDWPTLTTETTRLSDMPFEQVDMKTIRALTGAFDEYGNIRKTHVRWKSRRLMIEVTYIDDSGDLQKDMYDETYKPQDRLGEESKKIWINEWWEGTRLGLDIFVKMGPRKVQYNSLTNLSKCLPGVVGTAYNINDSKSKSLMDIMKPYQYLYNVFMYRTELAFAKNYGKIANLDLSRIPDDWDLDKWFHYATNMGFAPTDPFKEGKRGAATGKLAGNMQQSSSVMDMSLGNYINQHVSMLTYIEQQLGEIAGVSKQRQGQISSSEGLGTSNNAITQSSHITEKWFRVHDNVKKRVLEALMETAKAAWRNDKRQFQYVSDEMSTVMFEVDGALINEAEYGLFITDSAKDGKLFDTLQQLAQAGIQNDKLTFSGLMDIYHSDSITEVRRRIEQGEDDQRQREDEQLKAQQEQSQAQIQSQQEIAAAQAQALETKSIRESDTKIQVAHIQANSRQNSDNDNDLDDNGIRDEIDMEKLKLQQQKMDNDFTLGNAKLDEDKRKNLKGEQLEAKKISASKAKQTTNTK